MSDKPDPAERYDGWQNSYTGLGTDARDKLRSHSFFRSDVVDPETLEALYHEDDLAAKIVHDIVLDAMSDGFTLVDTTAEKPEDMADEVEELWRAHEEFGALDRLTEADIFGRLLGDAFVLIGVDGAGLPQEPLVDENVREGRLRFLTLLDRRDLSIDSYYTDPFADKKYGEPKTYRLNTQSVGRGAQGSVVHETRLVRFSGALTSRRERQRNGGWNHSVLRRVYAVLQSANSNWQSVATLMTEASVGKWKIKDLALMTAKGQFEKLRARMEAADMGRAVNRSVLLDAEFEDYVRESQTFAGLDTVIDKTWQRLAAAADMPVTRLMGMSPAGMNATGESDLQLWHKRVTVHRSRVLKSRVERLARLIARHLGDSDPDRWSVEWPALKEMSAKEKAEAEKLDAETSKVYVDMGAVLPEEVALHKAAGKSGFPTIDVKAREAMLKAEIEKAEDKAGQPDPVMEPNGRPEAEADDAGAVHGAPSPAVDEAGEASENEDA
jgi:phage-related protein (TIGR01555 family)